MKRHESGSPWNQMIGEPQPALEAVEHAGHDSQDSWLDWLAREALLAELEARDGGDWPGWGRTTVSGSKVQRPAIRRRAKGAEAARNSRNLIGEPGGIKAFGTGVE